MSRFNMYPSVRFSRSKFDMSHGVKTSMSVGKLYPLDVQEVLPGDTWKVDATMVARISETFLVPVIDNAYMDMYYFYVPLRLVYDDAERVFGNSTPSAYVDNDLAVMPYTSRAFDVTSGSVADYLGLPPGRIPPGVAIAPFRAFALIWNQWFRNQNTVDETYIQPGEYDVMSEAINDEPWSPNNYTGMLPSVMKAKDYFTSLLPNPQKGQPVTINLTGEAPVYTSTGVNTGITGLSDFSPRINLMTEDGIVPSMTNTITPAKLATRDGAGTSPANFGLYYDDVDAQEWIDPDNKAKYNSVYPNNLKVDLSNVTGVSVNDLRVMFQAQKMLERDALFGSRINEYYLGHFGVSNPDSRLQFAEYLGGRRIPITVQSVSQTSQGTEDSPLGLQAAFSLTNGRAGFSKSFTEHGYIFCVACIRTMHTYQQGISCLFQRQKRSDFYDPLYANLGNQPVWQSEIMAQLAGTSDGLKTGVFGYKEAWSEYRYAPSRITGEMRSNVLNEEGESIMPVVNSMDYWHFGDKYASMPVLSQEFTDETSANIDRTLTVPSTSQDNFIVDLWFNSSAVRVMPVYSMPGLIDHH